MDNSEKKTSKRQRAAHAMFMRRSYTIYRHMATRVRMQPLEVELPFTLEDLRSKVAAAIISPCVYCGGPLTPKDFSADHMIPLNRADEIVSACWLAQLHNVAICCSACQRLKGAMDHEEYRRLLALLAGFDPLGRRDVTRRLKAGGAVVRCGIATL